MLSNQEIKALSLFLKEDIKSLNLSGNEIADHANDYLENISGLELISSDQFQELINKIIEQANID